MEDECEPVEKRPKLSRPRQIVLDLDKFPLWVQEASEEDLIKIFEIGVLVKDSYAMNVNFRQDNIDDLLNKKFKPMTEAVDSLTSKVLKHVEEMEDMTSKNAEQFEKKVSLGIETTTVKLVNCVQEVAGKIASLDAIKEKMEEVRRNLWDKVTTSEGSVTSRLSTYETKLNEIASLYSKTATKGHIGEVQVMEILKELRSHTVEYVGKESRKGDIHVTSPNGYKYLIEVKKHQNSVNAKAIEKFESDVRQAPDFKVGILLSLHSGIAKKASGRRFEIAFRNEQYLIYVPNVLLDQHLVTWSVILADELVALNHKLDRTEIDNVHKIYQEFQDCVDRSKRCGDHLQALKRSVKNLEDSLVPLLEIIDRIKTKLKAALN